jgi:hypothetical protein
VSKITVAKLKRLSDAKILQLWRKKCPELTELWAGDGRGLSLAYNRPLTL